ncbi:MAG TPA: TerB family tellurite resistance protein [Kiloniellales bacterium]|nr:TerB family tellurite resistance protein [Kiloniellales bacterium]
MLFTRPGQEAPSVLAEPRLAVAALLVEAALMHAGFSEIERSTIERLLAERFQLDPAETRRLVESARVEAERSAQLFGFTSQVVRAFEEAERIELIEMLWEVAYADGRLDAHEDSLLRRVAGLIHVPDRARGEARLRVLRRLGLER